MKVGDRLFNGGKLVSTKCAGRQLKVFYTSPTTKYAELRFYAEPQPWKGDTMRASMAVQGRQNPKRFKSQKETMRFNHNLPRHLERNCTNLDLDSIEWMSDSNLGAIPYGVLVRTWLKGKDADYDDFSNPVDGDAAGNAQLVNQWLISGEATSSVVLAGSIFGEHKDTHTHT